MVSRRRVHERSRWVQMLSSEPSMFLNVGAAMQAQQRSIRADLGPYDGIHNSCVTYCVSILRAGGVDIPAGARGMVALKRTLG